MENGESNDGKDLFGFSDWQLVLILVSAAILTIMMGVLTPLYPPSLGFLGGLFWLAYLIWFYGTESGGETLNKLKNLQQQASTDKDDNKDSTKVCPECGWQNDVQNNFCNDCGTEL